MITRVDSSAMLVVEGFTETCFIVLAGRRFSGGTLTGCPNGDVLTDNFFLPTRESTSRHTQPSTPWFFVFLSAHFLAWLAE